MASSRLSPSRSATGSGYDRFVPDGLVPVLAWVAPDGFADGGDLPVGFVPVLFLATNNQSATEG